MGDEVCCFSFILVLFFCGGLGKVVRAALMTSQSKMMTDTTRSAALLLLGELQS